MPFHAQACCCAQGSMSCCHLRLLHARAHRAVRPQGSPAESLLTTDQESEHRRLRGAFNAFFNMKNIEAVLGHMAGACQQEMTRLQAAARAGGAGSVDVDVAAVSARLMDDLVWKVCSDDRDVTVCTSLW